MSSTQPAPDDLSGAEQEAVGALATFLAEAAIAATVALPPYIYSKLLRLGLDGRAIRAAAALTLRPPLYRKPARGPHLGGTAVSQVAGQEPWLRATYLINAAKRMTRDLTTIVPAQPGQRPPNAAQRLKDAVRRERRYWRQHIDAQRGRRRAAQAVDDAAARAPGAWLIWRTAGDSRVEADCRALSGTVFSIANPPRLHGRITFPGMVHPRCRCTAQKFGATPIRRPQPTR